MVDVDNNFIKQGILDKGNVPSDFSVIKELRNRNLGLDFINKSIGSGLSKRDFCKEKGISYNTLNKALYAAGMKNHRMCKGKDDDQQVSDKKRKHKKNKSSNNNSTN